MKVRTVVLGFALLSFGNASQAHHSYAAEFDRDKSMTIEGVVTEVWFKCQ